ncbi:MAG: hypothetical protein HY300_19395 [Verrucomicrobia bacterium]|nr:hypothetical protein [Verrucomicrobiota bacterium]
MSTVAQMESAIARLPAEEQQQLLQWLLARCQSAAPSMPRAGRASWLARLARLRARLSTGKPGPTVEQLLDEDRGE